MQGRVSGFVRGLSAKTQVWGTLLSGVEQMSCLRVIIESILPRSWSSSPPSTDRVREAIVQLRPYCQQDLEVELAVWKQAHATALEGAERETKVLKGRLASLNSQIASVESLMVGLMTS